jgi:hypothetical protein
MECRFSAEEEKISHFCLQSARFDPTACNCDHSVPFAHFAGVPIAYSCRHAANFSRLSSPSVEEAGGLPPKWTRDSGGGNCIIILWMSYLMLSVVNSWGQNNCTASTIRMVGLTALTCMLLHI